MPRQDSSLEPKPHTGLRLTPASRFTVEELTEAYNQTRSDYLVPMQMDPRRLRSYMRIYDVDLDHSCVALEGGQIVALGMLGVRPGRTWLTRLGVLPDRRRGGAGHAVMQALLASTRGLGCSRSILEVIQGNAAALHLFQKVGFSPVRDLVVLRWGAGPLAAQPTGSARWLNADETLNRLSRHPVRPSWTNELETYHHIGQVMGVEVDMGAGGSGWLACFREEGLLSHFVFHTSGGAPERVAGQLLAHLLNRYSEAHLLVENIPADDPHLPALFTLGFEESFRRIEMHWDAK
jgi:ribosomal protein S18 acetylase RimI-like enzyme